MRETAATFNPPTRILAEPSGVAPVVLVDANKSRKERFILAGDPTAEGTPRPTRVLGIAEVEELLTQFPPNLKPYITSLHFCGGRSGEAQLIEWSLVDLERKLIRIEDDQTKD